MAANIYYEKDADPALIRAKKVAIIQSDFAPGAESTEAGEPPPCGFERLLRAVSSADF